MSFQISLSSKSTVVVREYEDGIDLCGPYEVGLKHFVFWNTIYNVTNENNVLKFINGQKEYTIIVNSGVYELDDLITRINTDHICVLHTGTYIQLVKNSLKMKVFSQWNIDFTVKNSIGKLFGFSSRMIPKNTYAFSDLPVDIFSINSIKIHCNLVCTNIEDLKKNVNTLYEFPLDHSQIGGKVIKEPNPVNYFCVNTTDKIYKLVITITDQSNKLLDFRGESINLTLDFRPVNGVSN